MIDQNGAARDELAPASPRQSAAAAKAGLLAWADETDARTRRSRPDIRTIAVGGAIAALGGFAIARALKPARRNSASPTRAPGLGRRVIRWALLARVGTWLLPHAIRALRPPPAAAP